MEWYKMMRGDEKRSSKINFIKSKYKTLRTMSLIEITVAKYYFDVKNQLKIKNQNYFI